MIDLVLKLNPGSFDKRDLACVTVTVIENLNTARKIREWNFFGSIIKAV